MERKKKYIIIIWKSPSTTKLLQKINNPTNIPHIDMNDATKWKIKIETSGLVRGKCHWQGGGYYVWKIIGKKTTIKKKNEHLMWVTIYSKGPGYFHCPKVIMWALPNRIRSEPFTYTAGELKMCDRMEIQTIRHVVEECPRTKYKGGINGPKGWIEWIQGTRRGNRLSVQSRCPPLEHGFFIQFSVVLLFIIFFS